MEIEDVDAKDIFVHPINIKTGLTDEIAKLVVK